MSGTSDTFSNLSLDLWRLVKDINILKYSSNFVIAKLISTFDFLFQDTTSTTSTTARSRSDLDIGDLLFEDADEILYPSSSNGAGGTSTESGIVERYLQI